MDAPPIELYKRDPVAFLVYVELQDKPRSHITLSEVCRIARTNEKQAKAAVRELVELGALTPAGRGEYRPANAPSPDPVLTPTCAWCLGPRPTRRPVYCSDECSDRMQSKLAYARQIETRGGRPDQLHCVVCRTAIPRRPRSHHQKYCSRICARVVERQKALERDIAAGTAGTCKTCGQPMRAALQNWCSPACRPQTPDGLPPASPSGPSQFFE